MLPFSKPLGFKEYFYRSGKRGRVRGREDERNRCARKGDGTNED
jgi:hypothetical protein